MDWSTILGNIFSGGGNAGVIGAGSGNATDPNPQPMNLAQTNGSPDASQGMVGQWLQQAQQAFQNRAQQPQQQGQQQQAPQQPMQFPQSQIQPTQWMQMAQQRPQMRSNI